MMLWPAPRASATPGTNVLKIHLFKATDHRPSKRINQNREQARQRQILTVIFAIVLISIAGVSSAQPPQPNDPVVMLQYDGASSAPHAHPGALVDATQVGGGAVRLHRTTGDARPSYVYMSAYLANFDADADPDGWRAEVVLLDRDDRPVMMRAHAKFELVVRVATADQLRFVNADVPPIRWSMPLEFDEDGVSRVRLPLREKLQPLFGWPSAIAPPSSTRYRSFTQDYLRGRSNLSRPRTFVARDLRTLLPLPTTGELRVRVSVPTEGVFNAVSPILLRPSGLVDTRWPYR